MAALVAMLASVGVVFAISGYDAVAGPIVCLIAVIAGLPHLLPPHREDATREGNPQPLRSRA